MSNLTTEQVAELHDLALARLAEFDSVAAHLPKLLPAYVRIVIEVYEEWRVKAYEGLCRAEEEAETPRIFEWHRQHLDYADTNGTVAAPNPTIASGGSQTITAADLAAFEAVWPSIPDLQGGADVFAAECGPPSGEPEPPRPIGRDRAPVANGVNGGVLSAIKEPLTLGDMERVKREEAELHEIIATLQGIAVDGLMPTITAYRAARPKHLPEWTTITTRYPIATWREMAKLCGLRYAPATSNPAAEPHNQQPTLRELTDWLRANAMGGVMMSQEQFNLSRPAHWSTATAHVSRLHTTWEELRVEAGLKPNPRARLQPVADAAA